MYCSPVGVTLSSPLSCRPAQIVPCFATCASEGGGVWKPLLAPRPHLSGEGAAAPAMSWVNAPPSLPATSFTPPAVGRHAPAGWCGGAVVFACVGSPAVVGHGWPTRRKRHVLPERYGPTTLKNW